MKRREFLKGAVAGSASLWVLPGLVTAQGGAKSLGDKIQLLDGGGTNVVAFAAPDGVVLVDSGAPKSGDAVMAGVRQLSSGAKVTTLFNTHYHLDQTGNNEMCAAAGAKIIAHERTREWMSTDYWVPDKDRYEKARPKAAQPTETFQGKGSKRSGSEQIDYGYLTMAHTNGDIYVFFRNANVIAVGDVASPSKDPSFDWFTGAWIGGRVDALDIILAISNDQTKIVPAFGPVLSKAQLKTERDVMEEVRSRLFKQVREGDGPKDMLEEGLMKGLGRTWEDPYKFLYDACKGLWAHHDKLDPNVV
ncbi:MAG TPA: MBL fold metallo-hydrolase [Bryobacteraceae bacterium]